MLSKCQICLEEGNPSVVTPCGHIYCRECITVWMDDSQQSSQRCPTCKRQLKKEEFQELTSEVCSICQSKPKLPVLTKSGTLSCWACHRKTRCDQVIPIYGTDDEPVNEDPAVPPRPVLQPDVIIDVDTTTVNSRPFGGQATNQIDDPSSASSSFEFPSFWYIMYLIIGFIGVVIIFGLMIFPMTGVFFISWLAPSKAAHYTMCGFFFAGELISLLGTTGLGKKDSCIFPTLFILGRLLSFITIIAISVYIFSSLDSFSTFSIIWAGLVWGYQVKYTILCCAIAC